MSLTTSLNTAKAIFRNTSEQTSVLSTNIANTENENYVRRSATVVNTIYGATVTSTERAQQQALLRQLTEANSAQVGQKTLLDGLTTMTSSLGGNEYELSPSTYLSNLRQSLETYAASPGQFTLAASVVSDAQDVVQSLSNATDVVQKARRDADASIASQVEKLNKALEEFETVNDRVVNAAAVGEQDFDALDRRETLVKEISGMIGVKSVVRPNNDMALYTYDGTTLFETIPRTVSFTRTLAYDATVTGNSLFIDGTPVEPGEGGNTTAQGSLPALLQLRDEIAPKYQSQLDEVARGLVEAFRETDPSATNPDRPGLFTWSTAAVPATVPATGTVLPGLAGLLTVNPAVVPSSGGNPQLLRDGGINGAAYVHNTTNSASYTALLNNYITQMGEDRAFDPSTDLKSSTDLMQFASDSIGWIEELRSNATSGNENKTALYERSFQAYASETGVSLDEELSLLLDVEQSYKAAAKLVSTVDEMLAAVIQMAG